MYGESCRLASVPESIPSRDEFDGDAPVSFWGVTCINNTAEEDGGVLYAKDSNMRFEGQAKDNVAKNSGGAFYLAAGTVMILRGEFRRNRAMEGGAIFGEQSAHVRCADCEISNNHGVSAGGGAAIVAGLNTELPIAFQCDGCTIKNNRASVGGIPPSFLHCW